MDALDALPVVNTEGEVLSEDSTATDRAAEVSLPGPLGSGASGVEVAALGVSICFPGTDSDDIGVRYGEARVHGWWTRGNCPDGVKAEVTTTLYALFGDYNGYARVWVQQDTNSRKLYPGSSRRVLAHRDCVWQELTGWRVKVDVDVIGYADPAGGVDNITNLYCRPSM
ncbi:hypothetical protein [Demequina sp. NBRC 110052]|uniref:hypothetical protein n=1 Tax=Demequina sp. NBRC 110052 TaxID=1570341 RepID=UPI00190EF0E0|nr:hypothetical protein [Demequina sp. NBRC 110052]